MRLLILLAFLLINPVVYGDAAARIAELIRETAPAPVPASNPVADVPIVMPDLSETHESQWPDGVYAFSDPTWCDQCIPVDAAITKARKDPILRKYRWCHSPDGTSHNGAHVVLVDRMSPVNTPEVAKEMIGKPNGDEVQICIPTIVKWEGGKVVRSWTGWCNRPLDAYTIHWLATGIDVRPVRYTLQDGGLYPTRSGWWSVDDEWQPSEQYVLDHLIEGPEHADRYDTDWLYELTYAEMMSLHSDAHENRVQWDYVYAPGQYEGVKLMRPASRSVAATAPKAAPRLQQTCPNGMCPAPGRRR